MKPLIIYHRSCPDGFGAAYSAWLRFGDEAEYLPMQYGEEFNPDLCKDREVYILDFSFPKDKMLEILNKCDKMVWLDHHISAQPLLKVLQDAEKARITL